MKLINETLKRIPGQGYIEGQHFMTLETLVTGMSDPDWLVNAASRVANGCEVLDVLFPEQLQSEEDEQVEQEAEQTEAVVATPAPVSTLPALPGFFPSAPAQAPVQPVPAVVATALPQAPAGVPLKRHVGQNRLVF